MNEEQFLEQQEDEVLRRAHTDALNEEEEAIAAAWRAKVAAREKHTRDDHPGDRCGIECGRWFILELEELINNYDEELRDELERDEEMVARTDRALQELAKAKVFGIEVGP